MKTQMALLLATIMFFSSCIIRVSGEKDKKFKVSEKDYSFVQTYKISQPGNLKISTSGGDINTIGYGGDSVEVSFVVTKYGRVVEMTLSQLKQIANVKIVSDSSTLEISIDNISQRNINVGFNIKTPVKTSTTLNTSGGNIEIKGLTANQQMNTSGGNIDIMEITGDVAANTSGGNISLKNSTGKLNVETSGGNIDAEGIKPELKANTSGGNLNIINAQGFVQVSTSGGSINLDKISGAVKANTSGGNISAMIIKPLVSLELETSGGNIECTLPEGLGLDLTLSADNINTTMANFSGKAEKEKIQGKMNGGGIPVNLISFGGEMNLNYK